MTNDRKRLLVSIATALVLHLAVLILTGLNSFDYEVPQKYGPLLVELTLPVDETAVKPDEDVPVQELTQEIAENSAAPAPSVVSKEPAVVEPQAEPARSLPAATVKPAAARPVPPAYTRSEPDEDLIASLKNRMGGTGGVDARSVFGDDPVPAVKDSPGAFTASGRASGSEVVLSDIPAAREEDYTTEVRNNSVSSETSVLAEDDLSSLDARLTAVSGADNAVPNQAAAAQPSSGSGLTVSSGDSPLITFESQSASRELHKWEHPEIPEEIRREGAGKYTVVIDFLVDSDGFISGYKLRKPSGKAAIDAAVQSAMRTWVFEPAPGDSSGDKKTPATLTYVIEIK